MKQSMTIKNPLTIIAIFAGVAESAGTVVLPFLQEPNQNIYIWFLMTFPFTIVILFFITLNWNHKVLYAPSDFQNEENFFNLASAGQELSRKAKEMEESKNRLIEELLEKTNLAEAEKEQVVEKVELLDKELQDARKELEILSVQNLPNESVNDFLRHELNMYTAREYIVNNVFPKLSFADISKTSRGDIQRAWVKNRGTFDKSFIEIMKKLGFIDKPGFLTLEGIKYFRGLEITDKK